MSDLPTLRKIGNRSTIPMFPFVSRETERQANKIIRDSLAALSNGKSTYNQYVDDALYDGEAFLTYMEYRQLHVSDQNFLHLVHIYPSRYYNLSLLKDQWYHRHLYDTGME